jgi:TctA family transporter
MDTWIYLSQGFAVAMTPENLVIALIGCFVGTIVGLLPGLGPINGVAILLAAGLCPASACGIGADPAGNGLYRL